MNTDSTFWLSVLIQIQYVIVLVGVIIFMIIPQRGKKEYLELGLILWVSLVNSSVGIILIHVLHRNPNAVGNIIYTPLILPLGILFFRRRSNWKNKNIVALVAIVLFIVFDVTYLFFNGVYAFNAAAEALTALGYIIMSLSYFYVLMKELPTESITKLPMFWVTAGFLLYYSGIFIILLSSEYLISIGNNLIDPWKVYVFIGVIFYSILAYAMLLIRSEYLKRPEQ